MHQHRQSSASLCPGAPGATHLHWAMDSSGWRAPLAGASIAAWGQVTKGWGGRRGNPAPGKCRFGPSELCCPSPGGHSRGDTARAHVERPSGEAGPVGCLPELASGLWGSRAFWTLAASCLFLPSVPSGEESLPRDRHCLRGEAGPSP